MVKTATFATNPEFAAKVAEPMAAFPEEAKQFLSVELLQLLLRNLPHHREEAHQEGTA